MFAGKPSIRLAEMDTGLTQFFSTKNLVIPIGRQAGLKHMSHGKVTNAF